MTSTSAVPMAMTMGDASGVGPELVVRSAELLADGDIVVVGDLAILALAAARFGSAAPLVPIASPSETVPGQLSVIDRGRLTAADHRPGQLDAPSGAAALDYVAAATDLALAGEVSGIVTMPVSKEATQLSTPGFVGHTEFIAERCGASNVTMMLTTETDHGVLAVTHVSTHCSLREAIERVRVPRIVDVIELTNTALGRFVDTPRVAVCGLNPHAGEHGLFGDEDERQIAPAIEAARIGGIDVSGPHPADTVFYQAVRHGRYDAIVAMYHDQGHGPMKLLAFDSGVNVTLGLPIVRTSVDHGTAFDIAWTGTAFTDSLYHALTMARRLVSDTKRPRTGV